MSGWVDAVEKKVALLDPDEIKGLDIMMREAITLKFIAAALTGDQLKELIQIPPRR
jgi:NitT/TauT family transport system substrate-binding protein